VPPHIAIYSLGIAGGFALCLALSTCAKAEELSEIGTKAAAYCALYSRESIRIQVMHPTKSITADTDVILELAKKEYAECLSILPNYLPLPAEIGSLKSWLADMRDLIILRNSKEGVAPAADKPEGDTPDEEEWRAQCRAEYSTWEEETGTVVRRGNPERVRCPCGGEVTCGQ